MINKKYYHPEIKWYTRLLPWFWINNIDDPVPPSRFEGHYQEYWLYKFLRMFLPFKASRWLWWRIRNPLHNFMYYTIGLAGRDITISSKYPGELFASEGFNWIITKYKWIRLPGISYKGKPNSKGKVTKWYIGWMDDGEFGLEAKRLSVFGWITIICVIGLIAWSIFI